MPLAARWSDSRTVLHLVERSFAGWRPIYEGGAVAADLRPDGCTSIQAEKKRLTADIEREKDTGSLGQQDDIQPK